MNEYSMNEIPIQDTLPDFKFPDFKIRNLSNGVRVYLSQSKSNALLNIRLMIPQGTTNDRIKGLSKFLSGVLTRGTALRTHEEIAGGFDFLGATFASGAYYDDTMYSLTVLNEFTENAFSLFAESILEPGFREDDIERQRVKQASSIMHGNSEPEYLSKLAFNSCYFTGTGYSNPVLGTEQSINIIDKGELLSQYENYFIEGTYFIITGNFDEEKIVNLLNDKFGKLRLLVNSSKTPLLRERSHNSVVLIGKKDVSQISLKIGWKAPDRFSSEFPATQLANTIFGGYFMSRLNHLLREVKGYTYGIFSQIMSRKYFNNIFISTDIKQDTAKEAIEDILRLRSEMSELPIEENEFLTARRYLMGSFLRGIETPQQQSMLLRSIALFGLPENYYDNYYRVISEMDINDINEAASTWFTGQNLVIAAAGDNNYMSNELSGFGDIMYSDENGKLSMMS